MCGRVAGAVRKGCGPFRQENVATVTGADSPLPHRVNRRHFASPHSGTQKAEELVMARVRQGQFG